MKLRRVQSVAIGTTAVLVLTWAVLGTAHSQPETTADPVLAMIREAQVDLSPTGKTVSDCIVVYSSGRFQRRLRHQQLPEKTTSVDSFESSLSDSQLRQFRHLIEAQNLHSQLPFVLPKFPVTLAWMTIFEVTLPEGGGMQRIGFFDWTGGDPGNSLASTPAEVKQSWQDSKIALRPLADWFHSVQGLKMDPSTTEPLMCDNPTNDGQSK